MAERADHLVLAGEGGRGKGAGTQPFPSSTATVTPRPSSRFHLLEVLSFLHASLQVAFTEATASFLVKPKHLLKFWYEAHEILALKV